jgi:phosphatidylserine/phosphatidylglycerophosphate/cardiolipin synthase-like enzyme
MARPNGWALQNVVYAITKAVRDEFPESRDTVGLQKIRERLRVCGVQQRRGDTYDDGTKMGMHTKCFIVDDVASYIGSQNIYVCDLAEWGVVIDDKTTTQKLLQEYWSPMWECSYKE